MADAISRVRRPLASRDRPRKRTCAGGRPAGHGTETTEARGRIRHQQNCDEALRRKVTRPASRLQDYPPVQGENARGLVLREGFEFAGEQYSSLLAHPQAYHRFSLERLPLLQPAKQGREPVSQPKNQKVVRCAIYTRKSTEERLEQEFNSLDAQRESAEAYIASMRHEGWQLVPKSYDDGGFTGGNMERPALHRLLSDIEAGKIDCVVVYKVDRLSRSLMDFARMMNVFEKHCVSFVSVMQQFNTASSMRRLLLNVLLSFAQFEREMISERVRAKIAASRRKGKYVGGQPILGYNVENTNLIVNATEADQARQIFELYLEHQAVVTKLNRRGWLTNRWVTRNGIERGSAPLIVKTLNGLSGDDLVGLG